MQTLIGLGGPEADENGEEESNDLVRDRHNRAGKAQLDHVSD
jgi:hypothetical protein